ncbi:unnamed protein product [Schistocephalus solidus]|uniref:palmitoyl-protein hydrolase n=1 Tax=Schistocephalus solidus TaxID=70667 RepID=A0A183TEA1_SCHSO|nr:unnamed protein product [Schistocephalus solidus]
MEAHFPSWFRRHRSWLGRDPSRIRSALLQSHLPTRVSLHLTLCWFITWLYRKARPVALNMNMVMPAWHDIYGLDFDAPQDENGIKSAAEELSKWVDAEVTAGIPANRIIVGGFSQGGSVSLYYALTNKKNPITGVVALSCWLPLHARFMQNPNLVEADKSLPIFQCHGTMDPIVPFEMGSETSTILKNMGFSKSSLTKIPGMGHSSSDRVSSFFDRFISLLNTTSCSRR